MTATNETVTVGETTAFEAFYRSEFRRVVTVAYALSGSRVGAEDLAQEAFIAAHRRWDEIGRFERPEAWVRRVVTNMAVSAYRRRMSEARALARVAGRRQEVLPELEPEDAAFWQAVRSLPRRQAQAIALHYLEDRSISEVADILGCTPSTARVHLFNGRRALAEKLGLEVTA
jgi:RNA polymerase sigma factor (sigma-70 family)